MLLQLHLLRFILSVWLGVWQNRLAFAPGAPHFTYFPGKLAYFEVSLAGLAARLQHGAGGEQPEALPSGLAELCVGAAANRFLQPGGNYNTGLMRSPLANWDERRSIFVLAKL